MTGAGGGSCRNHQWSIISGPGCLIGPWNIWNDAPGHQPSSGTLRELLLCGLTWPAAPSCRRWEGNVCPWTLIWIWTWTWTSSCISSSSCLCLWLRLLWSCCGRRTRRPCCAEQPGSPCWLAVSEGGPKVLRGSRRRPATTANLLLESDSRSASRFGWLTFRNEGQPPTPPSHGRRP